MAAHVTPQPLVRLVVHVTPEQRAALAADAADSGLPMAQIVRDLLDKRYHEEPKVSAAGWHVWATVRPRTNPADGPLPNRARLREWVSGLGRRR